MESGSLAWRDVVMICLERIMDQLEATGEDRLRKALEARPERLWTGRISQKTRNVQLLIHALARST